MPSCCLSASPELYVVGCVWKGWFSGLMIHWVVTCPFSYSAEKQTQASASPGRTRGLDQVHRAHSGLRRRHRGGPAGVRRHLLPTTQLSVQAEGEALGTWGRPGPRCHQRLPGKKRLF